MSIITIIIFNNNDDHNIQYLAKVYSKISKDIRDKGLSNMEAVSMPFQSKSGCVVLNVSTTFWDTWMSNDSGEPNITTLWESNKNATENGVNNFLLLWL